MSYSRSGSSEAGEARLASNAISGFAIGSLLGSGTFSHIYSSATANQEKRALKVFHSIEYFKVMRPNDTNVETVVESCSAWEKVNLEFVEGINCPHAVRYFRSLEYKGRQVFELEHCKGKDLSHYFFQKSMRKAIASHFKRNKSIEAEERIRLRIMHILEYLASIHRAGRMHRDIKPANIIIPDKAPQETKICDLGSMREGPTYPGSYGTTQCGGPESFSTASGQQKYCCSKTDIYAVGVTMFFCFTSEMLHSKDQMSNHSSEMDSFVSVRLGSLTKKGGQISVDAFSLLQQLLKANPDERISAEDALNHRWFSGSISDKKLVDKKTTR